MDRLTTVSRLPRRKFIRKAAVFALGVGVRPALTREATPDMSDIVTLFLCGDVMTGRGIDQVLPFPSNPRLYESHLSSALEYVEVAEAANGPISKPAAFSYVWGDALEEFARRKPAVRIINLETAVTTSDDFDPKGINYRMSPRNFACIVAAEIDCCVVANNHVLDWGHRGLLDTIDTIATSGLKSAGAGRNIGEASAPAVLPISDTQRVIVFGFGLGSSGIPHGWGATTRDPGVNLLSDLGDRTTARIARQVRAVKRAGDIVIASIHWGGNWGYDVPREQVEFAHALIDDAGVDVVHCHSSHHAKAIEVYRNKLVLYGCGDFLNDYEGISGYEAYRDDLAVMYFPAVSTRQGTLARLSMIPLRIRKFRLDRAPEADVAWLRETLTREGARFNTRANAAPDGSLTLAWS
jgi:poly-gamma-glutamate synthesis protein (capsule biosynthesis protein)